MASQHSGARSSQGIRITYQLRKHADELAKEDGVDAAIEELANAREILEDYAEAMPEEYEGRSRRNKSR